MIQTLSAAWTQQNTKCLAEVHQFHDGESHKFMYRVYEKYVGVHGQLVAGPMVVQGIAKTLPHAKKQALKYMGVKYLG